MQCIGHRYRYRVSCLIGIIGAFYLNDAHSMSGLEIRQSILELSKNERIVEENKSVGLSDGFVTVWANDPTISFLDFTDKTVTGNTSSSIASPAALISNNTPIKFKYSARADVTVILSDEIADMDLGMRIAFLSENIGISPQDPTQLAQELNKETSCYYKRYISRAGGLDGGVIVLYPKALKTKYGSPNAILECVYEGLIFISGLPRTNAIRVRLGNKIGTFDFIALKALYNCASDIGNGLRISSFKCASRSAGNSMEVIESK